jgi:hypothetical protein
MRAPAANQGDSMRTVRLFAILAIGAALSANPWAGLSGIGDAHAALPVTSGPPAEYRPQAAAPKAAPALVVPAVAARRITLAETTASERAVLKEKNKSVITKRVGGPNPGKSRPLAIGFPRALPGDARTIVLSDLSWQAQPDGSRAARIEITSPGAAAVRIALALPDVHPDLTLKFAGNGARAEVAGPYPANAVAEAATRDGMFWTPVLEGDTAIIEFHAAADTRYDGVALVMGPLSHLVVAGEALQRTGEKRNDEIGDAGSCNIDVACVTPSALLTQTANSVGKLVFNDRSGATYLCSGTMLKDLTTTFTPYLFTANHCINEAFVASTLNVYWFFRAQACASTAPPPYALQTGGAMLLARSDDFDWALLRLNREPPAGVLFAAWRAEPIPEGAIATGLHHPAGDLAKFSQGNTTCVGAGSLCAGGYQLFSDGSTFIRMQWSQGTTETGSSGSGLFTYLDTGGYYELRGGLFGGDASCSFPTGPDYYSRLDNMLPLTRQYLTPDAANPSGLAVAVEFYNRDLDHFFISTDANEINLLDTGVLRGWERTGIRFLAYNVPTPGTNPVCRLYLRPSVGDSHFYSGDPNECTQTLARFGASWIYESPSVFYIALPNFFSGECAAGTRPIWRFFNTVTTNHRYTPEVTIRDALRLDSRWVAEGYGPDSVIMCSPASN